MFDADEKTKINNMIQFLRARFEREEKHWHREKSPELATQYAIMKCYIQEVQLKFDYYCDSEPLSFNT